MCAASAMRRDIYEWADAATEEAEPDPSIQIDWKAEITLADLLPDEPIEISWPDRPPLYTTARKLMRDRSLPGFLTLDQIEFIFSD